MDPMMERSDPDDRRSVTALIANRDADAPTQPGTPDPGTRAPGANAFAGAHPMPSALAIEAFRTLALTIERTSPDKPLRSVAVLSARPREGRSFTAEMLARALSELRTPVRLLEVDQADSAAPARRGWRGLRDRLRSRPAPRDIVLDDYADASDLAAPDADVPFSRMRLRPDSFANQREFLRAIQSLLVAETGTTVIDVPPCSTSSLSFYVGSLAHAAIYVVRPSGETSTVHADIRARLDVLGARLLGVVVNEG